MAKNKLWARALTVALAAALFGGLYFFVRQGLKDGVWRFDLVLVNKSLATTSLLLLALSMLWTGLAYFSKSSARRLADRKYFGLAGFWAGLAHAAVDHLLLPAVGLSAESGAGARHAEAFGLLALILFGLMAAASNDRARNRMGGERWRRFLRYAGYAGLVLAALHAASLKGPSWVKFFRTFDPILPSLSLPMTLIAGLAVGLRLAVWATSAFPGRRTRGKD